MKILIFSWRGPNHPNAGGAEIVIQEYAKGWVKSGHEVTLFTSFFKGAKKHEIVDGVEICRAGDQILGVQVEGFLWYLFKNKSSFDLIIDNFHGLPFFTPLYIRRKKLAFIHEVTKDVWGLNPWPKPFNLIPAFLGPLTEPYIFKVLYHKTPFLTVSESTRSDLLEWGISGSGVTVINNGVNTTHMSSKLPKERKKIIVFLGALAKDKGIEDAIESFSLISKNLPDICQFWIIGKGKPDYEKDLRKKVQEAGMTDEVKFWGYVSEDKKFELLQKAHILVNPSKREGWGLVVIEGGVVGVPTVGYDVPGLRDSIIDGKTGILCKASPNKLAESVVSLIQNTDKYNFLSKEAALWSKKFSWEHSIEESLKLLEKIVES